MDESAISSAIAKLKEHPEIISAVASALAGGSEQSAPAEETTEQVSGAGATGIPMEKLSEIISTIGPMLSDTQFKSEIKGSREDHRYALLFALRPYLSDGRREMVDYVLRFGRIGDLIKKMK